VGRTTGPLTPSQDAKPQCASMLERKGQQKHSETQYKIKENSIKIKCAVVAEKEAGSRAKTIYRQGLP